MELCTPLTCMQVSTDAREGIGVPGTGVPDVCELLYIGARNQILVLCKSSGLYSLRVHPGSTCTCQQLIVRCPLSLFTMCSEAGYLTENQSFLALV